jgi:TonB-linked SusC/RagA family outer membrane protein
MKLIACYNFFRHYRKQIAKSFLIMKMISVLIVAFCLHAGAKSYSQKISLSLKNATIEKAFKEISSQSGYSFFYTESLLKKAKKITISLKDVSIDEALNQCFKDQLLTFSIVNQLIVIKEKELTEEIKQETQVPLALEINGKVTDESGSPLAYASVVVKSTNKGTATDKDGKFSISVDNAGDILVFSYVGYVTIESKVAKSGTLNIVLKLKDNRTEEIVVVGYGTRKKSDLTGAVSSISTKDFKDQPIYRIDQALQGRASGVQVVNNAGAPGGDVSIRIRGANSILGDNNPLYVIDGFIGADFNNINPRDVESIEVLKDASGTAIYGSRGANGVVLITTKKGSKDKTAIEFTSIFSSAKVLKNFELLNAVDFATTVNQKNADLNLNLIYTPTQIDDFRKNGGTDWQNEIFQTAPGQERQLSVSGGRDKTNYFVSGNYLNENGVIIGSGFKRYSLRSNFSSNITDKLKVSVNMSGVRKVATNTQGADGKNSPLTQALAWAPTTPVRDNAGNYVVSDPVGSIAYNPVALSLDRISENATTNGNVNARANYEILKGLTLDVLLGVDYISGQGAFFGDKSVSNNIPYNGRYTTELINLQNTNMINYNHIFNKVHNFTITGVFENQSITNNGFSSSANNLLFPNLTYYNLTLAGTSSSAATYSKAGIVSYIGRVNYSFKDKYLLTASVRRDGSSKFQGDNRYSTFPSAAFAWKISEEPFIKEKGFFDQLKLRLSYGVTGSQAIDPYATLSTYKNDPGASFNNAVLTPSLLIGNPSNADLKWETTKAFDAGLDIGILKGRLGITIDYYKKNTSDLLMPLPVAAYLGGGSIVSNVGEIQNSGWEFSFNSSPVRNNNFTWTSNFVLSFLDNNVVSLGGQDIYFYRSNVGAGLSTQPEFVLKPGYGVGSYWGLKYLGTWKPAEAATATLFGNKPGDSRYEDINGDNKINSSDFQIVGNGMPKTSLGWNNTFQYKSFSLNIFIQSLLGYDKLNYTYGAAIAQSADARQATLSDITARYIKGNNESSDIPAFSSSSINYLQSTRFFEKGDFVRLKNINLSYDLPASLLKKVGIKVFIGAINLYTITGYKGIDPESSSSTSGNDLRQGIDYGSYPNSKKFFAGVVLKF